MSSRSPSPTRQSVTKAKSRTPRDTSDNNSQNSAQASLRNSNSDSNRKSDDKITPFSAESFPSKPSLDATSSAKSNEPRGNINSRKEVEPTGVDRATSATTPLEKDSAQKREDVTEKMSELQGKGVSHLNGLLEKIKDSNITSNELNKLLDESETAIQAAERELEAHETANLKGVKLAHDMKVHLVGQDHQVGLGDSGKELRDNVRQGFILIGTSCLGNLELIKQIRGGNDKTPHLIIADISLGVSVAWDKIRAAIISSSSWGEMVRNVKGNLEEIDAEDSNQIEGFLAKLGNIEGTSFQDQEELYRFLRDVTLRAIMVPCDYSKQSAMSNALASIAWASKGGDSYRSNLIVYASNIYSFLKEDADRSAMVESMASLRPKAIIATNLLHGRAPSKSQTTNDVDGDLHKVRESLDL
jgi:hypothetical protein